jgi:hypothetical protein
MPYSPPTRCPKCLETYKGKRCPHCNPYEGSTYKRDRRDKDPRWQALRRERLRRDRYCTWPMSDGLICAEPATHVDHTDSSDRTDDSGIGNSWLNIDNTRSLCADHHNKRTAQQGRDAQRSVEP